MTHLLHISETLALFCPSLASSFSHQLRIGLHIFRRRRWWFYLAQATSEFYAQFDFDIVPGSGWVSFILWGQRSDSWQTPAACSPLFTCQIFRVFLASRTAVVTVPFKCININMSNNGTQICERPIKIKLHLCGKTCLKERKRSHVEKGQQKCVAVPNCVCHFNPVNPC